LAERLVELSVDMLATASGGYFTRLNPAWERTLGWTGPELMAEPFLSFVHPDDVEATTEQVARLDGPDSESVVGFENRYRTRDGDYRVIDWTLVADETVSYLVAKDVTDRRAIESERNQAASLTQAITASVADGLTVGDSEGTVLYINASGLTMLGYEAGETGTTRCITAIRTARRIASRNVRSRLRVAPVGPMRPPTTASGARTARRCRWPTRPPPCRWPAAPAASSSSATSAPSAPQQPLARRPSCSAAGPRHCTGP
jgi:PAS domain S-box-containing protein